MACSAIYFLDNKGKVLLCRNYRGDIDNNVIENFISKYTWLCRASHTSSPKPKGSGKSM